MPNSCKQCGQLIHNKKKFCCNACGAKYRTIQKKIKLIKMNGSKCSRCGYDKNLTALSFHHLDPAFKENKLSVSILRKKSWQWALNEAKKCVILCCNCHAEEHNPCFDDWKLL